MYATLPTILAAATLAGSALAAGTCSITSGVTITFYGYPDNDPPGADTAYNCGGRNYKAGGVGTYDNPLTFASDTGEYAQCEIVYLPYLKKYLRMEDYCAQCVTDWKSGKKHLDVWTGSSTSNGGQTQINCEDNLTPNAQNVVRNPPTNLEVDSTALFSGGSCATSHTFPGAAGSCSGSSTGGGSTTPSGCQTGCSWSGHCIGCACTDENDCSDDFICNAGLCAAS